MLKSPANKPPKIILGLDVGTSGIRACIVKKSQSKSTPDRKESILLEKQINMPASESKNMDSEVVQSPKIWLSHLEQLLNEIQSSFELSRITHIIVDATSSTVLITDSTGQPLTDAKMYNDSSAKDEADDIMQTLNMLQTCSGAQGASSTLAKVLKLLKTTPIDKETYICHQVDFVNYYFSGVLNTTDENNALKLGYDSIKNEWPYWVSTLLNGAKPNVQTHLPRVVKPGAYLGKIKPIIANKYHFNRDVHILAGTTDSIAGFLASGAECIGDSVSSLGSTLAIKTLSERPIFNSKMGIYSHKLNDLWLVGGASNTGGKVLLEFYSIAQINTLMSKVSDTQLALFLKQPPISIYPLLGVGERFPICDSSFEPIMPKSPQCNFDDIHNCNLCLNQHIEFFLNLLLGMAQIEAQAYKKLAELGAPQINRLFTVGGGIKNTVWMTLRENTLKQSSRTPYSAHAAYGVTRLVK